MDLNALNQGSALLTFTGGLLALWCWSHMQYNLRDEVDLAQVRLENRKIAAALQFNVTDNCLCNEEKCAYVYQVLDVATCTDPADTFLQELCKDKAEEIRQKGQAPAVVVYDDQRATNFIRCLLAMCEAEFMLFQRALNSTMEQRSTFSHLVYRYVLRDPLMKILRSSMHRANLGTPTLATVSIYHAELNDFIEEIKNVTK